MEQSVPIKLSASGTANGWKRKKKEGEKRRQEENLYQLYKLYQLYQLYPI